MLAGEEGALSDVEQEDQGGMNPPIVVVHGNSLEHVTDAYKRFLEGRIREHFKLTGTPLRIEMRSGRNPFDDKKS